MPRGAAEGCEWCCGCAGAVVALLLLCALCMLWCCSACSMGGQCLHATTPGGEVHSCASAPCTHPSASMLAQDTGHRARTTCSLWHRLITTLLRPLQMDSGQFGDRFYTLVRTLGQQPYKDQEGYLDAVAGDRSTRTGLEELGDAHKASAKALSKVQQLSCK